MPLAIVGGGNNFPLQVPPGSPIKNLDDLKGKTVLTIVGSDLHLVLVLMVKAHFGIDDPKDVGITVRGNNAITELERAPSGVDAVLSLAPQAVVAEATRRPRHPAAQRRAHRRRLRRPGRQGRRQEDRELRQDAVCARGLLSASHLDGRAGQDYLRENPKVVTAMMIANQRAVSALTAAGTAKIIRIGAPNWPGTPEAAGRVDRQRDTGSAAAGRGSPKAMRARSVGLFTTKAIYQTALEPEATANYSARCRSVSRAAYEATGRMPPRARSTT